MKITCPACSSAFRPTEALYAASVYLIEFARLAERRVYLCRRCSRDAFRGTQAGRRAVRALLERAAELAGGRA